MNETKGFSINGFLMAPVLIVLSYFSSSHIQAPFATSDFLLILVTMLLGACWLGFFMVQPKQGRVLTMFGSYMGQ